MSEDDSSGIVRLAEIALEREKIAFALEREERAERRVREAEIKRLLAVYCSCSSTFEQRDLAQKQLNLVYGVNLESDVYERKTYTHTQTRL